MFPGATEVLRMLREMLPDVRGLFIVLAENDARKTSAFERIAATFERIADAKEEQSRRATEFNERVLELARIASHPTPPGGLETPG